MTVRSLWLLQSLVLSIFLAVAFTASASAAVDSTVGASPGASISSLSASASRVERGYSGANPLDRDAFNHGGMSKRIQCRALTQGAQGNTRLRAFNGQELGLALHALGPVPPAGRHCPEGTVNIQMNEAFKPSSGDETLFYQWGLSGQHNGGNLFGKSGQIRRSDIVSPPLTSDTHNGNCVNKSAGTGCNGTKAPDWFDSKGRQRWVRLQPTAMSEPMWHPHRNSSNKATGFLFNTTMQYGQGAWDTGAIGHAPMMWNWTNKSKGGVNRTQIPANTRFYISAVQPFATPTYQRTDQTGCVKKNGACTSAVMYKVARNSKGKPIRNGWIELAYGRVVIEGEDLYGWVVVRHRYGAASASNPYVNHYSRNDKNLGLPWSKADQLFDSYAARSATAYGTADDDVNLLEDQFVEATAADMEWDPEAEYVTSTNPGAGQPVTAWGAPPNGLWGNGHGVGSNSQPVGDINGDGRDEPVVFFKSTGRWYGVASGPTSFGNYWMMSDNKCTNSLTQYLADVNGDGRDDAICWYNNPTNQWWVGLSNGSGFDSWTQWGNGQNPSVNQFTFGDVNGDKRADLVTVNDNTGVWQVALSTGVRFAPFAVWHAGNGAGSFRNWATDVNGDGLDDAVAFIRGSGTWQVALSNGTSFGASTQWISGHGVGSPQQFVGDVDGDGKSDALVYFNEISYGGAPRTGAWFASLSNGQGFGGYSLWADSSTYNMVGRTLADTNGDKQADPVAMNPIIGLWAVSRAHDIRPPVVKITSGPVEDEVVTTGNVDFAFTTDETDSTLQCSVDEAAYAPCSSPLSRTNVPEGRHSLKVKSIDASGKTSSEAIVNYAVDFKVPDTVLGEVGDQAWWSGAAAPKYAEALYGDVNSDGKQDVLAPAPWDRSWHLLISDGKKLTFTSDAVAADTCLDDGEKFLSDVGGDDRPDLVCYNGTTDTWTVALAGGSYYFVAGNQWLTNAGMASEKRFVKDVNGDGMSDLVAANTESGVWRVALSTGAGFAAPTQWSAGFGGGADNLLVGDVSGDGKADIASFVGETGTWTVVVSSGTSFSGSPQTWRAGLGQGSFDQSLADVTGDGKADAVIYFDLVGNWFVARSTGTAFSGTAGSDEQWAGDFGNDGAVKALADLTGDGKADAIEFNSEKNAWFVAPANDQRFVRSTSDSGNRSAMFHSDDPFAKFECKIDSGAWAACTNPLSLTNLAHGSHMLSTRAIDVVGQVDPTPATRSFYVDRIGPSVTINTMGSGYVSTATPAVGFTLYEDGEIADITCAVDSEAPVSCGSNWVTPTLSQGSHTVTVVATDNAGNATTASRAFVVDTTAPAVSITAPQATYVAPGDATVEFTASDVNPIAARRCSLNGATATACSSPWMPTLSEGSHTLRVEAVDAAGNVGFASKSVAVDTSAPTLTITGGPANGASVTTSSVAFELASNESGSTFECKVDAAASYSPCSATPTFTGLNDGSHSFAFRSVDPAGNASAATTRAVTVDLQTPETTIDSGPANGATVSISSPVYGFSSSEPGTFECRVDTAPFEACTTPFTVASLSAGGHTFAVRAKDVAGNVDDSPATRTVVVETGVDTTITSGPAEGSTHTHHEITVAFTSNAAGATYECKLDSAAYAPCSSGWEARVNNGTRTISVRAKDSAGNYDPTPAQRSFTVDAPGYMEIWGGDNAAGWAVDLPEYGSYDWAHWGRDTATSFNHKTPLASPGIANWTQLGSAATVTRTTMPSTTLAWWNGTPIANDGGTTGAIRVGGAAGRGFRVTIPTTRANSRIIYLMIGGLNTTVNVNATMADSSAGGTITPFTNTSASVPTIGAFGFRVQSTNADSTVSFDITQGNSSPTGAVYLAGATVSND